MLNNFKVTDLFNIEGNNRTIEFNKDLTIIVGKNGSGKTTILNILHAIITQSFEKLFNFDFKMAVLKFDNADIKIFKIERCKLEVNYTEYDEIGNSIFDKCKQLSISLDDEENVRYNGNLDSYIDITSKYFPTYRRLETDLFELLVDSVQTKNSRSSYYPRRYLNDLKELSNHVSNHLSNNMVLGFSNKDINSLVKTKWNEAVEFEKTQLNLLVKNFMVSLLLPITEKTRRKDSDSFDTAEIRSDLELLFTQAGIIDDNDYSALNNINEYTQQLKWANTVFKDFTQNNDLKEDTLANLGKMIEIQISHRKIEKLIEMYKKTHNTIYEKKKPFDAIVSTLEKFEIKSSIIDGEIVFHKESGTVTFENLSAGEKQIIAMIMYTKLSFEEKLIIIIDEPELSLHVNWQRRFLKYLISEQKNVQFIISTHSPFIIAGYKNKVYPFAPMGDEEDE